MANIVFEWDQAKNLANQRKHSLSFEDASEVFEDQSHLSGLGRTVDGEQRWETFGLLGSSLLMVVHTVREEFEEGPVEVVRIISARYATPKERRGYENRIG